MKQATLKNERTTTISNKLTSYERENNVIIFPRVPSKAVGQKSIHRSSGNRISKESLIRGMKKTVSVDLIIEFIDGLKTEIIQEIKEPKIRKDLVNEEVYNLEHQVFLLDIIKNYLQTM